MISGPVAETAPRPKVAMWALTWRFLKRGRRYLPRILGTLLVILVACGAKVGQSALMKPILDRYGGMSAEAAADGTSHKEGLPSAAGPQRSKEGPPSVADSQRAKEGAFDKVLQWIGLPPVAKWHLTLIAWLAIGLSVLMFVAGYLRSVLTNYLTLRITADLRNDVAEHLAYMPLRYHYDRKSGDLVSRVTNDVVVTESAANFFYDDALVHPIMILCALGLVFWGNWVLALAALVGFPFYALPLLWLGKRMRKARKRSLERLGEMTGTMIETFGGIKTVKAFNREADQVRDFHEKNEGYFRKLMSALRRKAAGENLSQLFVGLGVAGLLVFSGWLLKKGMMNAGDMAVVGIGIAMMNSSVRELSKSYNRLIEASAGCGRVFELLDHPRDTEHETGAELPKVTGIEYRDVTFAYDGTPVLQGISLAVKPGEVVAFVGRTGAGKTTLLDLLCRFYDPQQGAIFVSGADLRTVKRSSMLAHVAVVTQETFLFNSTIGENIRYGRTGATRPEIEAAAKSAHIHDFIAGLERGYDTPVGERGAKLSGGQRQRVAIARAILRDPSILILDEATSALDAESEQAVQAGLANLIRSGRRITLVIAHRLSTVKNADRIVVLDAGRIAEEGSHDALLAKNGLYAQLYRTQFKE